MEYLVDSDIAQLYNIEKRELIKNRTDSVAQSVRTMRQFMLPEDIDRFEEVCKKHMYKAIAELREKYYGSHDECHSFIGIDPSGLSMKQLWDKTKQLEGRYKWLPSQDMAYSVEQNVYDKTGAVKKRPHVHLMIRGTLHHKPSYIAEKLSKHYGCESNFVDVKKYTKNRAFTEHLEYIKGNKQDNKCPLVKLDITDRETLGIPHFKFFS